MWGSPTIQAGKKEAPHWRGNKQTACNSGDLGSIPGSGRSPWRRDWLPTPVFLPGESHGQRSLAGYSPCGHKESYTTEQLTHWWGRPGKEGPGRLQPGEVLREHLTLPRSPLALVCPHPIHFLSLAPIHHTSPSPKAMGEVPPLPHSTYTSLFPCDYNPDPGACAVPIRTPRVYHSLGLPLGLWKWKGRAPAASPRLEGWYPAQVTGGRLSWYRAQKEGLLLKWQHQFCSSSSWSVQKSSVLVEMEDLQDPAGRFGQDDKGNKNVVWKSGPLKFRSHSAQQLSATDQLLSPLRAWWRHVQQSPWWAGTGSFHS